MKNAIKYISVCLLIFSVGMSSIAQEIYLEVKMDANAGSFKFKPGENIVGDNGDLGEVRNISIAASAQITEYIFLKSSLATNNFNGQLDIEWNSFGDLFTLDGRIRGQQIVFEILPEVRFFKNNLLFVNAGVGVVDMSKGVFYQGEASVNGEVWNVKDFSGYYHHFVANVGVNIQREVVGFILEVGYRNSGYLESIDAPFRMGFETIEAKLGISYRLRDAKKKDVVTVDIQ